MVQRIIVGILALGIAVGTVTPSWAGEGIPLEKIKAYATLYPDYFATQPFQNVNYTPDRQKRAAQLLVNSYNGNTDEAALSAVLRPSDRSPLKSKSDIEKLLASQHLSWSDYEAITQSLTKDPKSFTTFRAHLNQSRVKQELLSRAQTDPDFLRQVHSVEHQIILRNLLSDNSPKR